MESNKKEPQKEAETPAEIQRREQPHRRDKLDKIIKDAIEKERKIVLHLVAKIDDTPMNNLIAVVKWNLLFSIGESLSTDNEMKVEYTKTFPDGKIILQDTYCIDSLKRLNMWSGEGQTHEGKEFYLLNQTAISRQPNTGNLIVTRKSL